LGEKDCCFTQQEGALQEGVSIGEVLTTWLLQFWGAQFGGGIKKGGETRGSWGNLMGG